MCAYFSTSPLTTFTHSPFHVDGNGRQDYTEEIGCLMCRLTHIQHVLYYLFVFVFFSLQREDKGTSSQVWCLPLDQLSQNQPTHNPSLTPNPNHHTVNILKEWKLSVGQLVECQWQEKKEVRVVGSERQRKI